MTLQKTLFAGMMIGAAIVLVRNITKPPQAPPQLTKNSYTAPPASRVEHRSTSRPPDAETTPKPKPTAVTPVSNVPENPTPLSIVEPTPTPAPNGRKMAPAEFKARIDKERFRDREALLKETQPFRLPMLDGGNAFDGGVLISTSGFIHWNNKQVTSMVIERSNLNILLTYQDPSTGQTMAFSLADRQMQARIYKNDPYRLVLITPQKTFQALYTAREEFVQYGPNRVDYSSIASGYVYGGSEVEGRFGLISCDPTDSSCPSAEAVRLMVGP